MNKIDAIMEEAEIQLYDNGDSGASDMSNLRAILEKHLQNTTEKKCFYCEENKCNCEQQELIERHIADDTTEDVERICPHCGYATIPLKVNKPNDPYGKSLQDTTDEREVEIDRNDSIMDR